MPEYNFIIVLLATIEGQKALVIYSTFKNTQIEHGILSLSNPHHPQQPHSFEFLRRLDLSPSTAALLPLCIHLRSLTLPKYYAVIANKNKTKIRLPSNQEEIGPCASGTGVTERGCRSSGDLVLTAPLPDHFRWTMDRLQVEYGGHTTTGYNQSPSTSYNQSPSTGYDQSPSTA